MIQINSCFVCGWWNNAFDDNCIAGSCNGVPLFFSNQGMIAAVRDAEETTAKYRLDYLFMFQGYQWV